MCHALNRSPCLKRAVGKSVLTQLGAQWKRDAPNARGGGVILFACLSARPLILILEFATCAFSPRLL